MSTMVMGEDMTMQLCLCPVENADALDSLRSTVGLSPIEDYLKSCSDAVGQQVVWDGTKMVEDF